MSWLAARPGPTWLDAESVRYENSACGSTVCAVKRSGGQKLWMISRDWGTRLDRIVFATTVAKWSVLSKSGSVGTFLISMLACARFFLRKSRTCVSVGMPAARGLLG